MSFYVQTHAPVVLFVNRRTRYTDAEIPVELGPRPGPVTKIRHRWVCERPVDLLLNYLGTLSGSTIYTYAAKPMCFQGTLHHWIISASVASILV